jgi:hypothetical protein
MKIISICIAIGLVFLDSGCERATLERPRTYPRAIEIYTSRKALEARTYARRITSPEIVAEFQGRSENLEDYMWFPEGHLDRWYVLTDENRSEVLCFKDWNFISPGNAFTRHSIRRTPSFEVKLYNRKKSAVVFSEAVVKMLRADSM